VYLAHNQTTTQKHNSHTMVLLLRRRPQPPLSPQRQRSPQKQAFDIALAGMMSRASTLSPWVPRIELPLKLNKIFSIS